MAISQIPRDCPGRDYYLRKRATGKDHTEAMGCRKRRLSDMVYRPLVRNAQTEATGSKGHQARL
jgi:transposase